MKTYELIGRLKWILAFNGVRSLFGNTLVSSSRSILVRTKGRFRIEFVVEA